MQTLAEQPVALVVDLDGSLLRTDALHEELVSVLRCRPWRLPAVAMSLSRGRAAFKATVGRYADIAVDRLPYRVEVLSLIQREKAAGTRIILATAADQHIARAVVDHLGCFDGHLASDATTNLKGEAKLRAIRDLLGDQPFDYIGNHASDLAIWNAARRSYVVTRSDRLVAAMHAVSLDVHRIEDPSSRASALLGAMRPKQWSKNLLLALPMLAGHAITGANLFTLGVAFVAFSLMASAVYLVNDLHDLDADRGHPTKRRRPIADGRVSIASAVWMAMLLVAASLAVTAAGISTGFTLVLLGYFAASTLYTLLLKRVALLDVFWLAGLYVYRIIAGGMVIDVFPSHWLLTFTMFFFLSLALGKRYTEVRRAIGTPQLARNGRGYLAEDIDLIRGLGPICGSLAVLVVCLYLNSEAVVPLYASPSWLWLAVPLLFYWVARFWLRTLRGEMTDDPVVFALTDAVSYVLVALIAVLAVLAT